MKQLMIPGNKTFEDPGVKIYKTIATKSHITKCPLMNIYNYINLQPQILFYIKFPHLQTVLLLSIKLLMSRHA